MIKKVAGNLYAHKSNIKELKSRLSEEQQKIFTVLWNEIIIEQAHFLENDYVVKYNTKTNAITFSEVLGWNNVFSHSELHEPIILMYTNYKPVIQHTNICGWEKTFKIPKKTQVYHNKWQFVSEDYKGFDIQKAKKRTQEWNSIPNIKSLKSKIGYTEFWHKLLQENHMQIYVEN